MFKQSAVISARLLVLPKENPLAYYFFQSDPRRVRGYRHRICFDCRIDRGRRNRRFLPRRHKSQHNLQYRRQQALKKALDGLHTPSSVTTLRPQRGRGRPLRPCVTALWLALFGRAVAAVYACFFVSSIRWGAGSSAAAKEPRSTPISPAGGSPPYRR